MTNVYAYNDLSKRTVLVPAHHVDHPILGAHLTEVRNGKQRGRLSEIIRDTAPILTAKDDDDDYDSPDETTDGAEEEED